MEGKRVIVKNSIVLYIRLVVVMIIGLYSSRIVLASLGVSDFGVYQVVGSLVATYSVFSGTITQAINRFLIYEAGSGDVERQTIVFSSSIIIMLGIAVLLSIIGETAGLWFLEHKINIASNRLNAANWVYQLTILTVIVNLIRVPYNALLIAHEKMVAYSYFSMFEAVAKLGLVRLMALSSYDKLQLYAILILILALLMRVITGIYCSAKIHGCKFKIVYEKGLLKRMLSFAGINLYGSAVWVFNHQGIAIVLNLFFSTTVNAARGIANQVESLVNTFSHNILTAINPRITKCYASGDLAQATSLICWGVKLSYLLMLFVSVPLILESPVFLSIWLVKVPPFTVTFTRLALVTAQMQMLISTATTAVFATGEIKNYVAKIGSLGLLVIPITYILFKFGFSPIYAYLVFLVIYGIMIPLRIHLVSICYNFSELQYYKDVVFKCMSVTIISFTIPLAAHLYFEIGYQKYVIECLLYFSALVVSIYYIGFKREERALLLKAALQTIKKK